jgi:two-component system, chemotaxis family, protein-glutamate methylesterase/glutaminase
MIKVLIVDDSATVRLILEQLFNADPGLEVVGTACDGEEAIAAVERLAPDVITMDIYMPKMNGLDATARIMETHPTPIVILSGNLDDEEVVSSYRAMEAGALVALAKPSGSDHAKKAADIAFLVQTVKLMAEIRVVKRWSQPKKGVPQAVPQPENILAPANPKVVAIGASTGGPVVINTILSNLPKDFPLPVLIVQHMATGFIHGFAEWLGFSSPLPVHIASNNEFMLSGHVYIAPDSFQMLVAAGNRIVLTTKSLGIGQCPSVASLFHSVAGIYGKNSIGILLTGMGDDGANDLKLMKSKGAVTIAQDQESSIIFGMPGEAVKLGAATYVLPPDRIVEYLASSCKQDLQKI